MFKPDFLDFGYGSYISLRDWNRTGVGWFADKCWLGVLEVCWEILCDGFSPSKLDSFVCLPPTISFEI